MQTLISTIIPFYNRINLLENAVKSVIEQSHRPIEIILIDDCSSEILELEQFKNTSGIEIIYSRNEQNSGPGLSRERGMKIASGQFIHFLDSDDKIHPNFYTEAVDILSFNADISFVYSFTKTFDVYGIIGDRIVPQVVSNKILPDIFQKGRIWSTSSCIWNKDKTGTWINGVWEDYHFDIQAGIKNNKIQCIPQYYCYYQVDSSNKFSEIATFEKSLSKAQTINIMLSADYLGAESLYKNNELIQWLIGKLFTQIKKLLTIAKNKEEKSKINYLLYNNNTPKRYNLPLKIVSLIPRMAQYYFIQQLHKTLQPGKSK